MSIGKNESCFRFGSLICFKTFYVASNRIILIMINMFSTYFRGISWMKSIDSPKTVECNNMNVLRRLIWNEMFLFCIFVYKKNCVKGFGGIHISLCQSNAMHINSDIFLFSENQNIVNCSRWIFLQNIKWQK